MSYQGPVFQETLAPWSCFYRCLLSDGSPSSAAEENVVVNNLNFTIMGRYNNNYKKGGGNAADMQEVAKEREDKAFDLYAEMLIKKIETAAKTEWKKPCKNVGK